MKGYISPHSLLASSWKRIVSICEHLLHCVHFDVRLHKRFGTVVADDTILTVQDE